MPNIAEAMNFLPQKLKDKLGTQFMAMDINLGTGAMAWLEQVFPLVTGAEKIRYWVHVATPFLITAVVLTVVFYLLRCCCFRRRGGFSKMMKAPGRNCRMPRNAFESDPKGYFRNLRAHSRG